EMRMPSEIRAAIRDTHNQIDVIISAAEDEDRDLTETEFTKCQQLQLAMASDKEALPAAELAEAHFKNRLFEKHPEFARGDATTGWRADAKGNKYAILNKSQKAADLLRPKCADEAG